MLHFYGIYIEDTDTIIVDAKNNNVAVYETLESANKQLEILEARNVSGYNLVVRIVYISHEMD